MTNRFNLVEEPWIPVVSRGLVSLADIFSDTVLPELGGNPVQKISVLKLLLAITQTAWTPRDEQEWLDVGTDGMAQRSLEYLKSKKDLFWLYGDNAD